jgi:pyridoxine 5'-phosphate synthase PdxJ
MRNAKHPKVQELIAAAEKHGAKVLKVMLRRNVFHIEHNNQVRLGHIWKGIDQAGIDQAVVRSLNGTCLSDIPTSSYYKPSVRERLCTPYHVDIAGAMLGKSL